MGNAVGRPPRGTIKGKSTVMSLRLRPETRKQLEASARAHGTSLSQEAEGLMLAGLDADAESLKSRAAVVAKFGSVKSYMLMRVAASIASSMINLKQPGADWTEDPYLYEQVELALTGLLQLLRPAGQAPATLEEKQDRGGAIQWKLRLFEVLNQVKSEEPELHLSRPMEKWIADRVRKDLGDLVERIELSANVVRHPDPDGHKREAEATVAARRKARER